jgi:hypothetical protein
VVELLVISSNPKIKAGGSLATCRVSQAGEIKRIKARGWLTKHMDEGIRIVSTKNKEGRATEN